MDPLGGSGAIVVPPTEITLRYEQGMSKYQFLKRATALQELGEQGQLLKARNPVARDNTVARRYRSDIIGRVWDQYHTPNPEFADSLISRIRDPRGLQADHVWELQLGGPDVAGNLRLLDGDTNRLIGAQIRSQIRNLPIGAEVRVRIEG